MKELPKFKRGDYDKEYNKFSKEDKEILENYGKKCEEGCNQAKALDMKRNVLKFKLTINKPYLEIDLDNTKEFMKGLESSKLSDSAKNDLKVHVLKLLKFLHKDWSDKFENFESPLFKQIKEPKRKREIGSDVVLTKDEIKKMLDTE